MGTTHIFSALRKNKFPKNNFNKFHITKNTFFTIFLIVIDR